MKFIFDMDGTIVDTHKALKTAYRKAGQKMTDADFGKRWQDWTTQEVHLEKVRIYPNILRELGRRLPAADLLRLMRGAVLTGASLDAVQAVRGLLKHTFPILGANCDRDTKLDILRSEASNDDVIYFDDDVQTGRLAGNLHGVTWVKVTDYDGVYNIMDLRQGRMQKWTLSSWLPAVTND